MKKLFAFFLVSLFAQITLAASGEAIKYMPVQDGGRIKPYNSFAIETLEMIYGKKSYEGRPATEVIFTWMLAPQQWKDRKIFEVRNHQVLKNLGLPETERYFTGDQLFAGEKFNLLRQELIAKRETQEKLDPYFQAVQRLENQLFVFQELTNGRLLRVAPQAGSDIWIAVADLPGDLQNSFLELTKAFVQYLGAVVEGKVSNEIKDELDVAVHSFTSKAKMNNPSLYNVETRMKAEVHYNDFHPFRWAYVFYFLGFLVLLLVWILKKESLMPVAWIFLGLGFILNTYGFCLRMYIMERAPVSNMYETVVWVSWGVILFAAILEVIYKYRLILMAGSLVAAFGLVVADFAPAVLDPSLQPLEPVLRSNYWLTIHVMTITISYAAFFLAFGLGDIGVIYYLINEKKYQKQIKAISMSIYRCMQIGVAFLAPGIILGGIWADYSWGRFWGWDPKETWALIALLGYLAVLHARYAGMVRDFGMIVSAIVTFSLVIMAWYGVNFVLGAGLHSYGFGAGGVEYVSGFVVAHILLVIYVSVIKKGREKA